MGSVMELITDSDTPPKIQAAALAALSEMTDPIKASLSSASNGQCKCCHHDVFLLGTAQRCGIVSHFCGIVVGLSRQVLRENYIVVGT